MKWIFEKIPFLGQLVNVPKYELGQAFWETLTTLLFTTLPLWFLPFVARPLSGKSSDFSNTVHEGEVFVYCAALLGPLIYTITRKYGRFNIRTKDRSVRIPEVSIAFPYGGGFVTIAAFLCFLSAYAITELKSADESDSLKFNGENIEILSTATIIVAILVFYLVCCYRNMLDDHVRNASKSIATSQKMQEDAFSNEWKRSKQ